MESTNSTTKRRMLRTTWLLFAKWKYKHQIKQKGNNDKQHLFNRNTTQDNIRQENDNKQTKLFITYKQKETRPNIQNTRTLNCAKWKFKQYYRRKKDTNDVVVVCTLKIQTSYQQEGKHRQANVSQQIHNTRQNIRQKSNKQHTTHTYSICNYILTDTTHTSRPNVQHNQNVRTSNCAKWKYNQYYKHDDTNDVATVRKLHWTKTCSTKTQHKTDIRQNKRQQTTNK